MVGHNLFMLGWNVFSDAGCASASTAQPDRGYRKSVLLKTMWSRFYFNPYFSGFLENEFILYRSLLEDPSKDSSTKN